MVLRLEHVVLMLVIRSLYGSRPARTGGRREDDEDIVSRVSCLRETRPVSLLAVLVRLPR